jgi:hypothetical protein
MEINQQVLQEKWAPVLDSPDASKIQDAHRRQVTAVILENQEKAFKEERQLTEVAANATADVDNWDPVLISLVRRATPNLLAFDLVGVQPMTGPTGLIFAMKSQYTAAGRTGTHAAGAEALFDEANTEYSGALSGDTGSEGSSDPFAGDEVQPDDADTVGEYQPGSGNATATAEAQGNSGPAIPQMQFTIDKTTVTAKSRALKAEYTTELAQDLKAIHGLSAETELANILSTEILAEMNREIVRLVNINSVTSTRGTTAGQYSMLTADNGGGRWLIERVKAMVMAIEQEANQIAVSTRRGKGNFAIVSHGVAAALNSAGVMDTGLGLSGPQGFDSDVAGSLFAGTLNGRMKVYIDPYATVDYFTVGYKGTNAYDAGMFYCPYVPLSMMKTIGENDFQPRIGFKTRYGIADNPFVTAGNGNNVYYRKRKVIAL